MSQATRLNAVEEERVRAMGGEPEHYVVLDADVQINMQQPGGIMPARGPNGEVIEIVVLPLVLAMPLRNLRASSLLAANGQAPNPVEGVCPQLQARLVIPRARIAPEVMAAIEQQAAMPELVAGRLVLPEET